MQSALVGSTILGFTVALLALDSGRSNASMRTAWVAIVLAGLPLVDGVLAVVRRMRTGASPLDGDRRHLYDLVLARGWSPQQIALAWYAGTASLAACAWIELRGNSVASMLPGIFAVAGILAVAIRLGCLDASATGEANFCPGSRGTLTAWLRVRVPNQWR